MNQRGREDAGARAVRLEPIEKPWPDAAAGSLEKLRFGRAEPIALFRTLAHNPRVLERVRRGGLLDPGAISARARELVILRTTARCGAEYEWGVHASLVSPAAGVEATKIAATATAAASDAVWSEEDRALIRLADELHETATISDELYADLAARFDAAGLVELVILAGFYHAIAFAVNAFEIPLEADGRRFEDAH